MPIFVEKYEFTSENEVRVSSYVRVCLQGVREPQMGDVTLLAMVEKYPPFIDNISIPECQDEVSRDCIRACI